MKEVDKKREGEVYSCRCVSIFVWIEEREKRRERERGVNIYRIISNNRLKSIEQKKEILQGS